MSCEHLIELEKAFEFSSTGIFFPRTLAFRCQMCARDIIPEHNTWLNLNALLNNKTEIFYCEEHALDLDSQHSYYNLTNSNFWCRVCEKRFVLDIPLRKALLVLINKKGVLGIRGLKNLGSTCFINSVVHSLSNCVPLKNFLNVNWKNITFNTKLFGYFVELITNIWSAGDSVISPLNFINEIYNETQMFVRGEQNDAHEFFGFLLNYLSFNFESMENQVNIIEEIFAGTLKNSVQCKTCSDTQFSIEKTYDLTLSISFDDSIESYSSFNKAQNSNSIYKKIKNLIFTRSKASLDLNECLKKYFAIEETDKNDLKNLRECENCKQKSAFIRKTQIKTAPKHLVVVLKSYGQLKKAKVSFPSQLRLKGFCEDPEKKLKYHLYAVITHHGLNGLGHYKCHCKNHLDSNWYCFNDNNISKKSQIEIEALKPYMAFYELANAQYSFSPKV